MAERSSKSTEQQSRFGDDAIEEPPNSTVDDWIGQRVDRDAERADQAIAEAGGDERRAERLFEDGTERRADEPVTDGRPAT
jgi:hypothetical protein